MKRVLFALMMTLLPAAAQAGAGYIEVWTGVRGTHSAERVVHDHPVNEVVAEARILHHGADHAFLVEIAMGRSGAPALRVRGARAGGRNLDWEPSNGIERFCNGDGVCSGTRLGAIFMSRSDFERATVRGLAVRLTGRDGPVDLVLPPQLFAEARVRATWLNNSDVGS